MKILVLADNESEALYDFYDPEKLEGIELIISCGDLEAGYLEFFATMSHAPVLYVHGNHDYRYEEKPPTGCICIDGELYVYKGIRILGLGGSRKYNQNKPNQYTERQMSRRIHNWKLQLKLLRHRGFDILVTHAAAYDLNDLPDIPHRGFKCFRKLLDKYHPKFYFHGHVHANYGTGFKRKDMYGLTTVINAYEYVYVDYSDK